jgi:hypothetical protein
MTSPDMSPTEVLVSQMWGRILGVQPASVDDDFFDLDGSSVQLMLFLQEILTVFHVELDLVGLFAARLTVAESARAIDQARSREGSVPSEQSA